MRSSKGRPSLQTDGMSFAENSAAPEKRIPRSPISLPSSGGYAGSYVYATNLRPISRRCRELSIRITNSGPLNTITNTNDNTGSVRMGAPCHSNKTTTKGYLV